MPPTQAYIRLAPPLSGAFWIRGNPHRPVTQTSRNQPCPCGSGKRYKHCCGAGPATAATTAAAAVTSPPVGVALQQAVVTAVRDRVLPDLPTLMQRALGCQKQGRLADAEALYREALTLAPANFDALHMLGVVRLQLDEPEDGARCILRAIRAATVEYPPAYANLALCLCAIARRRGILDELLDSASPSPDAPRIEFVADLPACAGDAALVSVLLCPTGEPVPGAADPQSLARQTHRRLERVAAPTLNACVREARGRFLAPFGAGDAWDADRIELMTRLLLARGRRWGFSGVRFADAQGRQLRFGDDAVADELMRGLDAIHSAPSLAAAFLQFNHAVCAGNLLVERGLWEELGGFRDDSPDPAWDFCVRAALCAPPAILYEPKYTRLVGSGAHAADAVQLAAMRAQWRAAIRAAFPDQPQAVQRILAAQHVREWRLLDSGRVRDVEPRRLIALAEEFLAPPHAPA